MQISWLAKVTNTQEIYYCSHFRICYFLSGFTNVSYLTSVTCSPLCRCGASLRPCSSVGSLWWDFSHPVDAKAPVLCCPTPQTQYKRRVQVKAWHRSPVPRAHLGREPMLSAGQERRWPHGSACPASTRLGEHPASWLKMRRASWLMESRAGHISRDMSLQESANMSF